MMIIDNRVLAAVLIAVVALPQALPASSGEAAGLAEALGSDGYVLYWRHARTNQDERDYAISLHQGSDGIPGEDVMADCTSQRTLSERGLEEAEAVGRALRKIGFVAGSVHSSSYCRNLETAELGFPRKTVEVNDPALFNQPALTGESQVDGVVNKLRALLSDPPDSANRVLVGHNLNLQSAADVRLQEGKMALFRPGGDDGFELIDTFGKDDLETVIAVLGGETGAWQREDAEEQAVAAYQHMTDVEAAFDTRWRDAASSLHRSRLRNAARLQLARQLQDDPAVDLSLIDYYLVLARAALDDASRSRLEQAADTGAIPSRSVSDEAREIVENKAWMHGNEALHPDGRVPHIDVPEAIDQLAAGPEGDMLGDVIEVTGMLDFSFVQRAQERDMPHGFYLLSAHAPKRTVFSDLICVRDDVGGIELGLPWPDGGETSDAEREAAILSRIRTSDNGFADYTQRNLLGTTPLGGRLLNATVMTDCRTFLK